MIYKSVFEFQRGFLFHLSTPYCLPHVLYHDITARLGYTGLHELEIYSEIGIYYLMKVDEHNEE